MIEVACRIKKHQNMTHWLENAFRVNVHVARHIFQIKKRFKSWPKWDFIKLANQFDESLIPGTNFFHSWMVSNEINWRHSHHKRRKEMLNVKISSNSSNINSTIEIIAQVKTTLSQVQTLHQLLRNESHVKERKQKSVNAMNYRIRINWYVRVCVGISARELHIWLSQQ